MTGTWRVFRGEWFRMMRGRGIWILGTLLAAISALRVVVARAFQAASEAQLAAQGHDALERGDTGTGWAPLIDGWRAGMVLSTLLLLALSARSLASDRDSGVLRLAVTRSAARSALVLGRALLAPPLAILAMLASGLGAWIAAYFFYEFGDLTVDGYPIYTHDELVAETARNAIAILPGLVCTYVLGLFVASFARSGVAAVSLALAVLLAFDLFKDVLGESKFWIFASFAPTLDDSSAMNEMAGIARGFADKGFPDFIMRMSHVIPFLWGIPLLGLACLVTSRRAL